MRAAEHTGKSGGRSGRASGRAVVRALVVVLALAFAGLAAHPRPAAAARLGNDAPPSYDRTFKADLVEKLPAPPQLVIFGGSRAQRFDPAEIQRLTGLTAFNFAVQNSRPEDVYAMSRWLFWRAPQVKLRCIWALQASTLSDSPMHPGLVEEKRFTQFLPGYLLRSQRGVVEYTSGREMQGNEVYGSRGNLLYNGYDARLARGIPFAVTLQQYLAEMVPKAAGPAPYTVTRAKTYFERTLELYNLHGVAPVLVIMPYHPEVLAAFRAAGWQPKEAAFKAYLDSLRGRYRFTLLDYTELAAFGGTADGFYDGAHIMAVNARRILAQAVKDAPANFR